jgi:hypothetical protein
MKGGRKRGPDTAKRRGVGWPEARPARRIFIRGSPEVLAFLRRGSSYHRPGGIRIIPMPSCTAFVPIMRIPMARIRPRSASAAMAIFEPLVAEKVVEAMLAEQPTITDLRDVQFDARPDNVQLLGGRPVALRVTNRETGESTWQAGGIFMQL